MPSERVQRQIDRLVGDAEEAMTQDDWYLIDGDNQHAQVLLDEPLKISRDLDMKTLMEHILSRPHILKA